jgi:hypothetical protein
MLNVREIACMKGVLAGFVEQLSLGDGRPRGTGVQARKGAVLAGVCVQGALSPSFGGCSDRARPSVI